MTAPETSPSPNPNIITPTIGRRLWFWPAPVSLDRSACTPLFTVIDPAQPFDAGVIYVWTDRMVNLSVTDHNGGIHAITSVRLLQGDESANPGEAYAQWMPYQAAQNAKAAAPAASPAAPLPGDAYVYPTRREEALHALVSGAAVTIAAASHTGNAELIADNILAVVNKLHPQHETTMGYAGTIAVLGDKAYLDGTTATGVAPLPAQSPAQQDLETEIQAKADNAPRVTPQALQDEIVKVHYFNGADAAFGDEAAHAPENDKSPLQLMTFCVLELRNGYTVHGVSACASPENYNAEIGRRIARENAERGIWQLLGFRLRDKLSAA